MIVPSLSVSNNSGNETKNSSRPSHPESSPNLGNANDSNLKDESKKTVILGPSDLTGKSNVQEEGGGRVKRKAEDSTVANRANKKKSPPPQESYDVVIANYARRCEKCNMTIVKGRIALQSKRQWRKFRHLDCDIHEYKECSELRDVFKQIRYGAKTGAAPEPSGSSGDKKTVQVTSPYTDNIETQDKTQNREPMIRTNNPSNSFYPGYHGVPSLPRGNVHLPDGGYPSLPMYLSHRNGPWIPDDTVEFERRRFYSDQYAPPVLPPRYRQVPPREPDIQETARNGLPYDKLGYDTMRNRP